MAENSIFSSKEITFLKELNKQKVKFILVGAAAAALQGAPIVTQDVDLWFNDLNDPGLKKALKKVGGTLVPQIGLNPPMFAGESVRLFDIVIFMHGLEVFSKEMNNTIEIDLGTTSVKVLKLERIIKSKETVNRPKDKLMLPVLKDVLKTIQQLKELRKEKKK